MAESVRRKPISSSSSSLMAEKNESAIRNPIPSSMTNESSWRKPISSSSTLLDGSTRRAEQGLVKTSNENLKAPRPNLMPTTGPKIDDFKHQKSGKNHQYPKKAIIEMDVDRSADDFINRFRQNLKIERKESMDEYKGMLDRGA